MSDFTYPKARHIRREWPPQWADYSRYKRTLQSEFNGRCVYCRDLDAVRGYDSFGVDHYKPKTRFPALRAEYSNLYYCCNTCNRWKSDHWEEAKPGGSFVPNPCDHVMHSHLGFDDGAVVGKSRAGRDTVELLHLNDSLTVRHRQAIAHVAATLRSQAVDARRHLRAARRRVGKRSAPANLQQEIKCYEDLLARAEGALAHWGLAVD